MLLERQGKEKKTSASVLDYIFTDEERLVEKLDYDTPLGKSDHVTCLPHMELYHQGYRRPANAEY